MGFILGMIVGAVVGYFFRDTVGMLIVTLKNKAEELMGGKDIPTRSKENIKDVTPIDDLPDTEDVPVSAKKSKK